MLNSESPVFEQELKAAIGDGVNVAFDAVGGPMFRFALKAMTRRGRMVVITTQGNGLVEIDLLRRGPHVVAVPEWALESHRPFDYLVTINRAVGLRELGGLCQEPL